MWDAIQSQSLCKDILSLSAVRFIRLFSSSQRVFRRPVADLGKFWKCIWTCGSLILRIRRLAGSFTAIESVQLELTHTR